ncbi:hypothetical protein RYX56_02460 [Alkalihalophilus lindianensis]|uniref:YVTN family beta-propeller protein n=1 Tax=Alkalihalophilus lindianensis TaxID=1630542 RepID=A0ABU3X5Q4_9BACI|nr:hypothetical protein [Alkalihalophilus lindianensis]MDV2683228.1 hypothetical protein [Alkalihalophilus lindianensis]
MSTFFKRLFVFATLCVLSGCNPSTFDGISEDHSLVIVSNAFDSSISFIDGKTHSTLTTWDTPHPVTGTLLVDHDRLLTYSTTSSMLYVYELSSGTQLETWEVNSGIDDAIIIGDTIYLTQRDQNIITTFSTNGERLREIAVGNSPQHLYSSGDELYVLNYEEATISVIDLETLTLSRTLPSIDRATDMILIDETLAWVGGHGRGTDITNYVEVIAIDEEESMNQIYAPTMPVAFLPHTDEVLVLSHGSNQLRLINPHTNEVSYTTDTVANPFSMAATDSYLFVAGYDSNTVEIFDLDTVSSLTTLTVGEGPIHLTIREEASHP